MLTDDERREIEAGLTRYIDKQAATVDALKVVQQHRGWVSEEGIRDVADILELSPDDVDGVATFYNLIFGEPVGRHVILLCNSISCWVMGYENLRTHLAQRLGVDLGGTSADGRFTLLPIPCLGTCDHAPAMMVDEDLYQDLTPAKIEEILARYD